MPFFLVALVACNSGGGGNGNSGGNSPTAPVNLKATTGDSQVSLSWSAFSGATSYKVYYHTSSFENTSDAILWTTKPTDTSVDVTGLVGGTQYFFRVSALTASGESKLSNEATATPRATPTGLTATARDDLVFLQWTVAAGATSYRVYYHTSSFDKTSDATLWSTQPTDTSIDVTGLAKDTQYFFRVSALTASGESKLSNEATETVPYRARVLIAPGKLVFSWDAVAGAQSYTLSVNGGVGGGFVSLADGIDATSYDLTIDVHLLDWANVRYSVEACSDTNTCNSPFAELLLSLASSKDAITYVKASNTGADDKFGSSVSLFGNTLAVGAWSEDSSSDGVGGNETDNSADNSGAVYVFRRNDSEEWIQDAYIKASNSGAGDWFGISVSLSGNTLAVGASGEDSSSDGVGSDETDNSADNSGAVYVFRRNDSGEWAQDAYIKASNTGADDRFGRSVSLSGNTLAVGAHREASNSDGVGGDETDNSASSSGAVYVFRKDSGDWTQDAYIKASNSGAGDFFGSSVSLSGNTLAVGALGEGSNSTGVGGDETDNSASRSGAVYVFRKDSGDWTQDAYIKASNSGADDRFGSSISLSGNTLAVGAYNEASNSVGVGNDETDNSASRSGAVYVFRKDSEDWTQDAYIKASNTSMSDLFGSSVSLSGNTLAVGAHLEDSSSDGVGGDQANNSADNSGAVYIFRKDAASGEWSQHAYIKAFNTGMGDLFGSSVSLSGNTLAVGAHLEDSSSDGVGGDQANNNAADSGAVYIY